MSKRKPLLMVPGALVQVEWVDAHSKDGWIDGDDTKELRRLLAPHKCVSVGYVLEHTVYHIALVQSSGPDPSRAGGKGDIANLWVIPSPMLRKIKTLTVAK